MKEAEKYKRIEQYLAGELPEAERRAFEASMAEDAQLRVEVQLQREVTEALEETDVAAFEASLEDVVRRKPQRKSQRRWIAILLAAIIAILIFWLGSRWLKNYYPSPTPEQIYANHVDLPDELTATIQVRSGAEESAAPPSPQADTLQQNWRALNEAYRAANYREARAILENFTAIDPDFAEKNPGIYYYHLGLIQLQLDQPAAAAAAFAQVENGNYTEDAAWKRALALLLIDGRRAEAREILRQISKGPHPRQTEARAVLKQLNR